MSASLNPFETLLRDFTASLALPAPTLDEDGSCTLTFDERLPVILVAHLERGELVAFTPLGSVSAAAPDSLLRELLRANHDNARQGRRLALAPDEHTVVLTGSARLEGLDVCGFERWLEDYVTVAEQWSARLSPVVEPTPLASGDDLPSFAIRV